jgi:hypothetical protein
MQLLARKRISGKRPKGAVFEASDAIGRFLIAKGLAERVVAPPIDMPPVAAAAEPLEAPVIASEPMTDDDTSDAEESAGVTPSHARRGRGRRSSESPA